jgi:hypothetical protein
MFISNRIKNRVHARKEVGYHGREEEGGVQIASSRRISDS